MAIYVKDIGIENNGIDNNSIICSVINNESLFNSVIFTLFYLSLFILLIGSIYLIFKRKIFIKSFKYLKIFYLNVFSLFISFFVVNYLENVIYTHIMGNISIIAYNTLFLIIFILLSYLFNKLYKKENKIFIGIFTLIIILFSYSLDKYNDCNYDYGRGVVMKPIIYFYPEKTQEINVKLEVKGKIIADHPKYDNEIKGWNITGYPDGKVIENGKEYSYIFWEAEKYNNDWDLSKGFIVEGKNAREFLEEKLSYMGLKPKEYNEFIVYWYPLMMNNKYNLVYFAGKDYEDFAPLTINPKPDSMLRIFMVMKSLDEKIKIEEQQLNKFERKGFSVIEWGGTIIK